MRGLQILTLADARRMLDAGIAQAEQLESRSNIAVVDAGGHLIAHARMDGAWMSGVDIFDQQGLDGAAPSTSKPRRSARTRGPAMTATASRTVTPAR